MSLPFQLELLLRILLAALLGALIGLERESRLKTAGIRTHTIVSLASALMMILSKYAFFDLLSHESISLDPSRIAAGVVTAIGFLGAGMIFIRRQTVSGLTTAAGIWATVGVGMALGAGLYLIGGAAALLLILFQYALHRNFKWLKSPLYDQVTVLIRDDQTIARVTQALLERRIKVVSAQSRRTSDGRQELHLFIKTAGPLTPEEVYTLLDEVPEIQSFGS